MAHVVPVITVEDLGWSGGHEIHVGSFYVGYRPYDGCDTEDVLDLISEAFGTILKRELGYEDRPEED